MDCFKKVTDLILYSIVYNVQPKIFDNGGMVQKADKPRPRELVLLGQRLKSWRKAKGWSQEKLAWAAGITHAYFNGIENGKVNLGVLTLFRLAHILEVSPAVFLLPVAEARKLTQSAAMQAEVEEQRIRTYLAESETVELQCAFAEYCLRIGEFDKASEWLLLLSKLHQHWLIDYTWAKYYTLRDQEAIFMLSTASESASKVAESGHPYRLNDKLSPELQQAFEALSQAFRDPKTEAKAKAKAVQDADFLRLREGDPAQWQALLN